MGCKEFPSRTGWSTTETGMCIHWDTKHSMHIAFWYLGGYLDGLQVIEKFVILMHDWTGTCTDVNITRKKLFAWKTSVQKISPTHAALEQHVKRAAFQSGHTWGLTLIQQPLLPSPSSWRWIKTNNGLYEPHWTTLPEASKTCFELVSCANKKRCCSRCKCKKAAFKCTALSLCEGECSKNKLTMYHSFTQMACAYVSQLNYICCLLYWFTSNCHFTNVQLFQYGSCFTKASAEFWLWTFSSKHHCNILVQY